ncbi:MAG: class I SAM-dependent methyltransferase [Verrucomicrobiota bacterium]
MGDLQSSNLEEWEDLLQEASESLGWSAYRYDRLDHGGCIRYPNRKASLVGSGHEITESWAKVFDLQYQRMLGVEEDTYVWRSSYDGSFISQEEMGEWLSSCLRNVREVTSENPTIMEIGCGNGLIYSKLIEVASHFVGLDTAPASLQALSEGKEYRENQNKTELFELEAGEIDRISCEPRDLVILNSVIQYFPSMEYLIDVIAKLEGYMAENSILYLGDVRSMDLQELFCLDVARHKVEKAKVIERAERLFARERELLFSAHLFEAMPLLFDWIDSCQVRVKRGRFGNEMSRYRYEVILRCKTPEKPTAVRARFEDVGSEEITAEMLEDLLSGVNRGEGLVLENIANERLEEVVRFRSDLEGEGQPDQYGPKIGVLPVDSVFEICESFPNLEIDLGNDTRNPGKLRICAAHKGEKVDQSTQSRPLEDYASCVSRNEILPLDAFLGKDERFDPLRELPSQCVSPALLRLP